MQNTVIVAIFKHFHVTSDLTVHFSLKGRRWETVSCVGFFFSRFNARPMKLLNSSQSE